MKTFRPTEEQFHQIIKRLHPDQVLKGGTIPLTQEKYAEIKAILEPKLSKHRAVKTMVDGERFDSKLEARVWCDLKLREAAGEIRDLRRQVRFSLFANGGEHLGTYAADFVFEFRFHPDRDWLRVVADAKSPHTRKLPGWNKIKRLMMACHSIEVKELL